jgi:cyclic pyranopterin phosphate synthase
LRCPWAGPRISLRHRRGVSASEALVTSSSQAFDDELLIDSFGRRAEKLRISVTDRCNFRCDFCMPERPVWMDQKEVLTFEEITRLATVMARLGVDSIRLSGGEPLVRKDLEKLVSMLVAIPGIRVVGMTTNGALLKQKARALRESGLHCVTLSLHSLKPDRYHDITGTKDMFWRVMEGLDEARAAGFERVKVNCVVTRGCNEDEILDFADLAHDGGVSVRFIEYMPFDGSKVWDPERVVSGETILGKVREKYELVPLEREHGATAVHHRFADGSDGEIGVITSMTKPFCSDCDRIRLMADGKMVPCLFSVAQFDCKPLLRSGASDAELSRYLRSSFKLKFKGVESMLESHADLKHVRPMYTIGG